jgi:hypothetical protein
MRWAVLIPSICALAVATSCGETGPADPSTEVTSRLLIETGKVVVFVNWDGEGIPNKRVEIVELRMVRTTNEAGIAEFVVPVGDYTVRVHEINRGGPPLLFVDTEVTVMFGEELLVEVIDCLPCV